MPVRVRPCVLASLLALSGSGVVSTALAQNQLPRPANQPLRKPERPGAAQPKPAEAPAVPLAPFSESEFLALVAKLDAPKFADRQRALADLIDDKRITLDHIAALLNDLASPLSPEQLSRLTQVAKDRFLKLDRGAVGMSFEGNLRDRVVVSTLYDPFPAAKLLRVGDIIVEAAGVTLHGPSSRQTIQSIIISHDAGASIPMVIRRGREKLSLNVPLGKYSDLSANGGMLMDTTFNRAWRFRARTLLLARSTNAPIAVDVATWTQANPGNDDAQIQQVVFGPGNVQMLIPIGRDIEQIRKEAAEKRAMGGGEPNPEIAGGAQPRGLAMIDPANDGRFPQAAVIRRINGGPNGLIRVMPDNFDTDFAANARPQTPEEELRELARARRNYSQLLNRDGPMEDGALPGDRQSIRDDMARRLALIDMQREAIEAELLERGLKVPVVNLEADPAGPINQRRP